MKFKTIFAFVLGVGVGSASTYFILQKKLMEDLEAERIKMREYNGIQAQNTYTTESTSIEPEDENGDEKEEEAEETFAEAIIKNSVLTEAPEKPDLFDYAKISLGKIKDEPPVEKSHDPIEEEQSESDFKMRKVNVAEFEDLCYSYEMQELTLFRDGYVTDYKDEPIFTLEELYPNASINDKDEDGHIYIAADYAMTVYDVTVVDGNYKDIYPDEEEDKD